MAARSPARSSAGPLVMRRLTSISAATIPDSVVLPRPGRAREQEVVDGLPAPARGAEHDLEVLLQARLADELVEPARPERRSPPPSSTGSATGLQQLFSAHRRASAAPPGASALRAAGLRPLPVVGELRRPRRAPRRARSRGRSSASRTSPRARCRGPAVGEIEVGDVEARLELDQQPLRGALADAGHERERREVVVEQRAAQRRRASAPTASPARASGPTPVAPMSTSNVSRSSRVGNP